MGCEGSKPTAPARDGADAATATPPAATLIGAFASVNQAPPDDGLERCSSCYLPTSWLAVPLIAKREYNHNTSVYSFGLPDGRSLSLPVCACILMRAPGRGRIKDGGPADFDPEQDAVRPYTPVSESFGKFELLVKRYENGAASQYLFGLSIGAMVEFKHILNIKTGTHSRARRPSMLAAAPASHPSSRRFKLMHTEGDDREVVLLYGNASVEDILLRDELSAMVTAMKGRLKVVHVIGTAADAPRPEGWVDTDAFIAETGWVDEAKIKQYAFPPAEDTLIFVCGVPMLYDVMCGPRTEKAVREGSVLASLGYTQEMVAKV